MQKTEQREREAEARQQAELERHEHATEEIHKANAAATTVSPPVL